MKYFTSGREIKTYILAGALLTALPGKQVGAFLRPDKTFQLFIVLPPHCVEPTPFAPLTQKKTICPQLMQLGQLVFFFFIRKQQTNNVYDIKVAATVPLLLFHI